MNGKILDIHKSYQCAPSTYYDKKNIYSGKYNSRRFSSCIPKKYLRAMIRAYNRDVISDDDKIKINENSSKYKLWNELNAKMKNICSDETCWMQQKYIRNMDANDADFIRKYTIKPLRPIDISGNYDDAWLSNTDIENVMKQFEKVYPNFIFMGPFPIDFAKYFTYYHFNVDNICKLINKGINQIGIIFNTGTLQSGGMHWVALFVNLKTKLNNGYYTVEYFDSVGDKPPRIISKVIDGIIDECCSRTNRKCINILKLTGQNKHQKGNNECGVYAMYFITERLKGRSYMTIQSNVIRDDEMNKFRYKFFRNR